MIDGSELLITGGCGSLGKAIIAELLANHKPRGIRVYSRDEAKHWRFQQELPDDAPVSFLIGDVRDKSRLYRAMQGVDFVIHTAAIKQVPVAERDPIEAIRTNIDGAVNVVDAALDAGVRRVMNCSTDKAPHAANLYGATKRVAESLFTAANVYRSGSEKYELGRYFDQHDFPNGGQKPLPYKAPNCTRFASCRWGNVLGSRGSVIQLWQQQHEDGKPLTVTDPTMTRFWITVERAARFILARLQDMHGGEIFIPNMPSSSMQFILDTLYPGAETVSTGIRDGEKKHECMITVEEARQMKRNKTSYSGDEKQYYIIDPNTRNDNEVFEWRSNTNEWSLTETELRAMIGES